MTHEITTARSHRKNIRQRFQRDLMVIIILVCTITLTVAAFLAARVKKDLSSELINRVSMQAIKELQDILGPLRKDLTYIRQWAISGQVDASGDILPLLRQFIPMLQQNSFISGLMLASSKGQEFMLIRDGGQWLTRSTDKNNLGNRVLWKRWSAQGDLLEEWREDSVYDPRKRTWFQGALTAQEEDAIHWTEPYTFFTRNEPGITASISWKKTAEDNTSYVAAFDILIADIGSIFNKLTVTQNGTAVLVEKDRAILAPFVHPLGLSESGSPPVNLSSTDDTPANIAALNCVTLWHGRKDPIAPFRFSRVGETWWGGFRPLDPDSEAFWIGVVLPESDITGASARRVYLILAGAAAILGLGLLLAYLIVQKYGWQLKDRPAYEVDDDNTGESLRTLIDQGESPALEFKSTMRMNLKTGKTGKEIELAWLKTVVAFLNTDGGTLLIGINDDGNIQGLAADGFESDDRCRLHFKNLISQHIGLEFSDNIDFDLRAVEGKSIAVIHCSRANAPAFLKHGKNEDFFIRSGPASLKLSVSQVLQYLKQR
jgi:hypothetical protein